MGEIKGFINYKRSLPEQESVDKRITHFKEFYIDSNPITLKEQSARCMDCGVPFCHSACPLGNLIPDFNDAVYHENWKLAYDLLIETNNFPEFTGRICPAPCEKSCVLNIENDAVTIEHIEKSIIEKAFEQNWVKVKSDILRINKKVAIVGSGPAGLACADQLNKKGVDVDVYERNDRIGGLLRYGIPDFKLEKNIIDRRIEILQKEGINFHTSVNVGYDIHGQELVNSYDAVVLTGGSTIARDLPINGRQLKGIHLAMTYLEQNNRIVAGDTINPKQLIDVQGKHVIVIGGGDTGADCVGTSNRLNAQSITQLELMPKPPKERQDRDLWPNWPMVLTTSTSHEEGCTREWAILTKRFVSEDGINVSGLEVVDVEWNQSEHGKYNMQEIADTTRVIPCDRVFLSIGFSHPQKVGLLEQLEIVLDKKGNVKTDNYQSSNKKVYAAGDMRRGQSLVVWAIAEGREAAQVVFEDLKKF